MSRWLYLLQLFHHTGHISNSGVKNYYQQQIKRKQQKIVEYIIISNVKE